jgi:hypothetical protein
MEVAFPFVQASHARWLLGYPWMVVVRIELGWLLCFCSPVVLFLVPAMLGCFRDSGLAPPFLCNTHLPALSHAPFFILNSIPMA